MSNVRKVTSRLFELMDEGALDPRAVAEACLVYMSEADVADMARTNELYDEDEDDDTDEEAPQPADTLVMTAGEPWETFCATEGF